MPIIIPYNGVTPRIDPSAFIAETAVIIGDVVIGPDSSIWYGCVLRGDVNSIIIGARTNIQDGTVIHVAHKGQGAYVGDDVTVGHQALIHACTIGNRAFVGMQAAVLDDAKVEDGGFVGAGALVTPGKTVPHGELWTGRPAKLFRKLTQEDHDHILYSADHYARLAKSYTQK